MPTIAPAVAAFDAPVDGDVAAAELVVELEPPLPQAATISAAPISAATEAA